MDTRPANEVYQRRSFRDVAGAGSGSRNERSGQSGPKRVPQFASRHVTPYERPSTHALKTEIWKKNDDLFDRRSSLYAPAVNTSILDASSSLRPFGSATQLSSAAVIELPPPPPPESFPPAVAITPTLQAQLAESQRLKNAAAVAKSVAPPSTANLFARLGVKGAKGSSSTVPAIAGRVANSTPILSSGPSRVELERQKRVAAEALKQQRIRERQQRELAEKQAKLIERQRWMAKEERKGFVVKIEGLVMGTSAEDVQTAFGAYGATTFCVIDNEDKVKSEEDSLVARLTFEKYADAETACARLNGAIADGRPLKVERVEPTPMPSQPTIAIPESSQPVFSVLGGGSGSGSGGAGPAGVGAVIPVPAMRKMYADEVERYDPRVSAPVPHDVNNDQDIEMDGVEGMENIGWGAVPTSSALRTGPKGNRAQVGPAQPRNGSAHHGNLYGSSGGRAGNAGGRRDVRSEVSGFRGRPASTATSQGNSNGKQAATSSKDLMTRLALKNGGDGGRRSGGTGQANHSKSGNLLSRLG